MYLEEKRSPFLSIIIWFSYNDVRCVTKTAVTLIKISNLYFIIVAVLLLHKKLNILDIQLIEVSQRHSKGIAIKNNYSSVYFGHICVGISRIFHGNVTDSNTTELFELNVRYWSRYLRWKWKCFILVKWQLSFFHTRITFHAFCITLFKNVQ